MNTKKETKKESKKTSAKDVSELKTVSGKASLESKQETKETSENHSQNNGALDYEKLSKAMLKDKEKYANEKFKSCWPVAREISETITNTIWDDSMKVMQDYPSTYAQTAAVCFFSFLCAALDAHLEDRFHKSIPAEELPKIEQVEANSEMIKLLLKRAETDCTTEGQLLLKNLLERDYGYLMAILKALNIENTALHNLLVSNWRFWLWDVMIPHLFLSEKKKEEAHA